MFEFRCPLVAPVCVSPCHLQRNPVGLSPPKEESASTADLSTPPRGSADHNTCPAGPGARFVMLNLLRWLWPGGLPQALLPRGSSEAISGTRSRFSKAPVERWMCSSSGKRGRERQKWREKREQQPHGASQKKPLASREYLRMAIKVTYAYRKHVGKRRKKFP